MKLGDGDMNLPFEQQSAAEIQLTDAQLAGGLVVMAAAVPVPGHGIKPALVFRFARPTGVFMDPILLVIEPHEMTAAAALVDRAARAAVKAASP